MSTRIDGDVDEGFGPVADSLHAAVRAAGGSTGASCCLIVDGRVVVDVSSGYADSTTGRAFGCDSLQMLRTATCGAVSLVAAMLIERGLLRLDEPVASHWPEFGAAGKERVTVSALLNHQAGIPAIDSSVSVADLIGVAPVVEALARQAPRWAPGSAHGFHAVTSGWLVGELVRRTAGKTIGAFFANEVADRLGLEFWIGLPGAFEWRVAPLVDGSDREADPPAVGSLLWRATTLDGVLHDHSTLNARFIRATEIPAVNGVATARSLAGMYAAAVTGGLLRPETLDLAVAAAVDGQDLVLGGRTRFGLGFALPTPESPLLGPTSFGSLGIGNAFGFGDVEHRVAFAYLTNRLGGALVEPPGAGDALAALRRCLDT